MEASPNLGETHGNEEFVDLGDLSIGPPSIEEGPTYRIERTRATLAYLLLGLLAALLAVLLIMLWTGHVAPNEFGNVAAIVTTPVVGLLGAATGYYYGRGQR
ncbi:MAG: hypothetical protein ACLQCU_00960 [Acidimicrobiales bacterium]